VTSCDKSSNKFGTGIGTNVSSKGEVACVSTRSVSSPERSKTNSIDSMQTSSDSISIN
jgi:hypothetical protein